MTEAELERRWQAEGACAPVVSVQYVQHLMRTLEQRARVRNTVEYIGGAIGIAICALALFHFQGVLMKAAILLTIAGGLFSTWMWSRRAKMARGATVDLALDGLSAYRRLLEKRRDLLHDNWRWYIAPVLPGSALIFVALALSTPRRSWIGFGVTAVLALAWILFVAATNERSATKLQREIDALDSLKPAPR